MIKRIIFDLDNTLIMWKEEYNIALKKAMIKHNIKGDENYISKIIDTYENYYDKYNKKNMLDLINKNITPKANIEFIDDFLYNIGYCSEANETTKKTLEYLNKKYDLIILTNWFTEPQTNRLKHAHIDKYFTKIIGGEENIKPSKESFKNACDQLKPNQCLMIGDNYDVDIIGANKAGLKTIFFNPNEKENKLKIQEIKDISELVDIL